eukprot:TRINITY_DN13886_c0_g1_i2.p1 TRINITY_DN13886_c0_g1~~TRINITY_DN13886_c0_g1_i2.p1  ORF type:complete len:166 (+),score=17.01 TRINITY_DN13886_c0_g1_i2:633-1130(+)
MPAQRVVYAEVLQVMKECLELCVPGNTLRQIHNHSVRQLAESMSRLGLEAASGEELAKGGYRRFYPTAVGHWLGMDVHDCATVGLNQPLEPGVVLTIEPGLYIRPKDAPGSRYAGIGVRIEDDVLITDGGPQVFTRGVPTEVADIERLLQTRFPLKIGDKANGWV